jgi:hypothetical protein
MSGYDQNEDPDFFDAHHPMPDPPDYVALQIEQAERRFNETKNPLWVWNAINLCTAGLGRDAVADTPFPTWIREYLRTISTDLLDLGALKDPTDRPPRPTDAKDSQSYRERLKIWRQKKPIKPSKAAEIAASKLKLTQHAFREYFRENVRFGTALFVWRFGKSAAIDKIMNRMNLGVESAENLVGESRKKFLSGYTIKRGRQGK